MIVERYENAPRPDFRAPDEPHRMLAELPLPVYVTTDYDSNMMEALKTQPMREPKRELCRWWGDSRDQPSIFDSSYEPTVANPVVFHLHGHMDTPESMLVTEDDYLDYVAVAGKRSYRVRGLLPNPGFFSSAIDWKTSSFAFCFAVC
jgi:hypothetical protein